MSDTEPMSDARRGELESLADKNPAVGAILGLLLGPVGYVYMGQWRWAVINFVTLNYLLLGIIVVPLHVVVMQSQAVKKLRQAGYAS